MDINSLAIRTVFELAVEDVYPVWEVLWGLHDLAAVSSVLALLSVPEQPGRRMRISMAIIEIAERPELRANSRPWT